MVKLNKLVVVVDFSDWCHRFPEKVLLGILVGGVPAGSPNPV